MNRRPLTLGLGVAAALLVTAGAATAVSRHPRATHRVLPAPCVNAPGTAGGALPNGRVLDQAVGRFLADGNTGVPASALGSGSAAERQQRAKALQQSTDGAPTPQRSGTGTPASGAPVAGASAAAPQHQGSSAGGGGGAGGPGGSGSGKGSGGATGAPAGNAPVKQPGSATGDSLRPQQQRSAPVPTTAAPRPVIKHPAPQHHHHDWIGWFLAGIAALVVAWLLARTLRRRSGKPGDDLGDLTGLTSEAAAAHAAAAIAADDHDLALRWTFVLGLLRLDEAGVVPYDPGRSNRLVAARLRSRVFRDLAAVFDRVTYGGSHATAADVNAARAGWDRLLSEAGSSSIPSRSSGVVTA